MVAITHPQPGPHLRLVASDEVARRHQAELAALRRRAVAVGLVVALLLALGVLLGRTGHSTPIPARSGGDGAELPVATRAYVVQPGDTLWGIARALQPQGDLRPLVTQLARARHGVPLRVGERITLP
jgi:Tfp pilus assembly protein FimV